MLSRLALLHLPFVLAVFGTLAGIVDGVDISVMNCTTLASTNAVVFKSDNAATTDYSTDDGRYLIFYADFTTPATFFPRYEDLFLAGGTTKCGGFFGGIHDSGKLFFGIQCGTDPAIAVMQTPLTAGKRYKMEAMYDRSNSEARGRRHVPSSSSLLRLHKNVK